MDQNNDRGNSLVLDQAFTMKETFITAVARHHAVINMGGDFDDCHDVNEGWHRCLENHAEAMGEIEGCRAAEREAKAWMKDARKQVELVIKQGLPWTIRSADTFWPLPAKKSQKTV